MLALPAERAGKRILGGADFAHRLNLSRTVVLEGSALWLLIRQTEEWRGFSDRVRVPHDIETGDQFHVARTTLRCHGDTLGFVSTGILRSISSAFSVRPVHHPSRLPCRVRR